MLSTYTLRGGNVHVAADEGQAVVHAHLQINHPETKQHGSERKLCLQPFCLLFEHSETKTYLILPKLKTTSIPHL